MTGLGHHGFIFSVPSSLNFVTYGGTLFKVAQVLYIAAPSTASDLYMMLPWALSILLLQVA
jgi:hypothetical protein